MYIVILTGNLGRDHITFSVLVDRHTHTMKFLSKSKSPINLHLKGGVRFRRNCLKVEAQGEVKIAYNPKLNSLNCQKVVGHRRDETLSLGNIRLRVS